MHVQKWLAFKQTHAQLCGIGTDLVTGGRRNLFANLGRKLCNILGILPTSFQTKRLKKSLLLLLKKPLTTTPPTKEILLALLQILLIQLQHSGLSGHGLRRAALQVTAGQAGSGLGQTGFLCGDAGITTVGAAANKSSDQVRRWVLREDRTKCGGLGTAKKELQLKISRHRECHVVK